MFIEQGLPPYGNKELSQIMGKHYPAAFDNEERLMPRIDPEAKNGHAHRGRYHESFAVVLRGELESACSGSLGYLPEDPLLADLWRWH